MWIIFKQNYTGPLGMYMAGKKENLPEEKVKQLRAAIGDENVIKICPPWEEHIDKKKVAAAELKDKADAAIKRVEDMKAEMAELHKVAARINILKKELDDATHKAEQLAKQAGIGWPKKG